MIRLRLFLSAVVLLGACDRSPEPPAEAPSEFETPDTLQPGVPVDAGESQGPPTDPAPAPESALANVPRASGVQQRVLQIPPPSSGTARVFLLDAHLFRPVVLGVTPNAPAGVSAEGAVVRAGVEIALAGGFVSSFYPPTPVGLLLIDGQTISSLGQDGLSTVVGVDADSIVIVRAENASSVNFTHAIQVGPRLLEAGSLGINPREPERVAPAGRAFVAKCDHQVAVGITEGPVNLYPLAQALQAESPEGLGCEEAANLSGGGMEALAVQLQGEVWSWGASNTRQASLLGWRRLGR